eukprot:TRINITY_DN28146_c0_g1_i1.p1 TRINITY_DN28146_c0_g1~~TRINITY_DN28146_c0_g1_i1.p1  ORF type:complete len:300 (-),score=64.35 TRINITY_DN28146_c0_g1_i1:305-1204(-)
MALLAACVMSRQDRPACRRRHNCDTQPASQCCLKDSEDSKEVDDGSWWADAASSLWRGSSPALVEVSEKTPSEPALCALVVRDRTTRFVAARAALSPSGRRGHRKPSEDVSKPVEMSSTPCAGSSHCEQLHSLYANASSAQTSLASKLAQFSGLVQFGSLSSGRAPPLELRMLMPKVEGEIETLFKEITEFSASLQELEIPAGNASQVRASIVQLLEHAASEQRRVFEEQRAKSRELQKTSPLLAPAFPGQLSAKLAASMQSPRTASTVSSPRLPTAPLEVLSPPPLDLYELEIEEVPG